MSERDYGNLEALAKAVDAGSDRLRYHLDKFEGGEIEGQNGQLLMVEGIRALYEDLIDDAAEKIYTDYESQGKKPPSEIIRHARARKIVEREHPDTTNDYRALSASIKKGQIWLAQKQKAISALQTLNKTERELTGYQGRQNQAGVGLREGEE